MTAGRQLAKAEVESGQFRAVLRLFGKCREQSEVGRRRRPANSRTARGGKMGRWMVWEADAGPWERLTMEDTGRMAMSVVYDG